MTTQKKILVVDDDRLMRMMLTMMLTRAGYQVISAENGRDAIDVAQEESPDLVLTDGLMPDMHGLAVCKALKRLARPPRVVLLTATTTHKPGETCAPDDVLMKPVRQTELIACIERQLSDACRMVECGS
ncbi:MAG: response regulator [Acidobacteriota bacterium]